MRLSQTSGFTLRLQQSKHVVLTDWSLDVTDDLTVGVIDELNFDLYNEKKAIV